MDTTTLMMKLIGKEIFQYPFDEIDNLEKEELESLYALAKRHDVAQILAAALQEIDALKPEYAVSNHFKKTLFSALYRYEKSEYDLNCICGLFEEEKIDYIVLKGAVLRKYYPCPYLRTSCDIDILIRYEDVERATELLTQKLQFQLEAKEQYDVSLFSVSGGHFELHFKLIERGFKEVKALCEIWNSHEITNNTPHGFEMSNEFFLLYHIYHMAKHFIHGGCGIKPLIDLWIIKNKMGYDEEKAIELLLQNDLLEFYRGISDLADVWFDNEEHTPITKEMEEYILQGGVYGTLEQLLAMSQNKKGGKGRHLLSKIFLSYASMLVYYPSLKKCPLLYPIYQVRRWCRIAFCGGRRRALNEIQLNRNLSELKKEKAKRLIDELGL